MELSLERTSTSEAFACGDGVLIITSTKDGASIIRWSPAVELPGEAVKVNGVALGMMLPKSQFGDGG